ncbi:hypothetical protein HMPREF9318_00181 [Streptococcus urinalis FB127-CNA-2]|uniref:DNA-directed RNA polymerase, beta subunit n=1 Tax=Streptococcus urinalis 2285-97 TaxID=764291 RepID=G5KF16_9STRE|nr:DNA-directed RNA polymerase subunit beta [Streptococcus urinalis]EHJ56243.1 DNA-directed RNA polymerase, beta subunit [Streptococcus urinalis 2285-97]EKS21983.1 hypothetical protein HMPREF9318_00181 [Streptococcus urinalis FB127-CNA-2]VEF31795.1 competence associated protein [Streptococcus urinalis]
MSSGWKYVTKQLLLILFIVVMCLIFLAVGLVLGYSVMGDGSHPLAILSPDKWHSIISKFSGK